MAPGPQLLVRLLPSAQTSPAASSADTGPLGVHVGVLRRVLVALRTSSLRRVWVRRRLQYLVGFGRFSSCVSGARACPSADAAPSSGAIKDRVLRRVLVALQAVGLADVPRGHRERGAEDVFARGLGLEVIRVEASAMRAPRAARAGGVFVVARVVKHLAVVNGAIPPRVSHTVNSVVNALVGAVRLLLEGSDDAVTRTVRSPRPYPAFVRFAWLGVFPEQLVGGPGSTRHA